MKFLLDSNTCIRYLNQRSQTVIDRLTETDDDNIFVCSVVKAELFYGAARSHNPVKSREKQVAFFARYQSLPFDDRAADHYAVIRSFLARDGVPIGPNDLMIAAIALAHDLTLVTHNSSEFSRVPNLRTEDWES
jgi:tRNA(fMet)-specific endonuclease VapC